MRLIPETAREITPCKFDALMAERLLRGERLSEALNHPAEVRHASRNMCERDLEAR